MSKGDKFLDVLEELEVIESTSLPQRILNRFPSGAKRQIAQAIRKIPFVVFTSNIDDLLRVHSVEEVGTFARTAVAGTGNVLAFTIPDGDRYHISSISIVRLTGDATLEGLYLGQTSAVVKAISQTAAIALHTLLLSKDLVVDETMQIYATVAAISTDSTFSVRMLYTREDMY